MQQDLQALPEWQRLVEHAEQQRAGTLREPSPTTPGAPTR
jgi:hypothetical protein